MPRTGRAETGRLCHVLNRGNGRAGVFHDAGDVPRLLLADNLAGAGELALVSRANTLKGSRLLGHWAEPRFHKE